MLPVDAVRRSCSILVVLVLACAGVAAAQQSAEAKPKVSAKPLTAEQLSVYRAVLGNWMEHDLASLNLAIQTAPLGDTGPGGDQECAKGIDLEPTPSAELHRFRPQDVTELAPGRSIVLVDPDRQRRVVRDNDPGKTIGEGKSIEDAVRNGFEHGLVTLSEIRFDKKHQLAIVSYGFFCGGLCGNGGTVVLEKREGSWHRRTQCAGWISRLMLPLGPTLTAEAGQSARSAL